MYDKKYLIKGDCKFSNVNLLNIFFYIIHKQIYNYSFYMSIYTFYSGRNSFTIYIYFYEKLYKFIVSCNKLQ